MRRAVRSVLVASSVLALQLSVAQTASATTVTMAFASTIDLSSYGGPSLSTFSGPITWDTSAVPIGLTPDEAFYNASASTLTFDGVSYSTQNSKVGVMTLAIRDQFEFYLSPAALHVGSFTVDVLSGELEFPRKSVFSFPYA